MKVNYLVVAAIAMLLAVNIISAAPVQEAEDSEKTARDITSGLCAATFNFWLCLASGMLWEKHREENGEPKKFG